MPIPEYIRPQLEVYQQLDATIAATGDNLAACIVGANYDLYRYGYEDLTPHEFKSAGDTIEYDYDKNPALNYKVDTASVAVFAKDVRAKLGTISAGAITEGTEDTVTITVTTGNPFALSFTHIEDGQPANLPVNELFTDTGYVPAPGDMAEVTYDTNKTTTGLVIKKILADGSIEFTNPPVPLAGTPTVNSVKFLQSYTGVISASTTPTDHSGTPPVTITDTGVEIHSDIGLMITFDEENGPEFCPFQDSVGSLYVEFRVQVIPSAEEDIFDIRSIDEIKEHFGTISMENELAYGCYMALTGSQGRGIYAIRVRSNDVDGYQKAVKKTESNSSTYNFCPITDDVAVMEAVAEFGTKMSQPDVKKWRVTRVGVDFPGEYDLTSVDADNQPLTASFKNGFTYDGNTGTLLTTENDIDFLAVGVNGRESALHYGDKVKATTMDQTFVIKRVISSKSLLLESGPEQDTNAAIAITLIKADTAENELEYVTNLAKNFADRRVTVVWADQAKTNDLAGNLIVVPNKFIACEVAGLASAILPQKSLTHTEITGVTQASRMYTKYTQRQLDDIAKEGVMIITQDAKSTPCYVRHQLTTEVDKGSLYYEDSCTRNLDNISYAITRELHGFIGKANVTVPALRKLKAKIVALLANFMQDTTDDLVGPSLVNYDGLTIIQDPVFKDRVIVNVNLYLPLPLNNIKVYEMAYAARVTI